MNLAWIPNLLTLGNLTCGFVSLIFSSTGSPEGYRVGAALILLAALLDGFDGQAARWLGVDSPLGKELDSLADNVAFGVAPGYLAYRMYLSGLNVPLAGRPVEFRHPYRRSLSHLRRVPARPFQCPAFAALLRRSSLSCCGDPRGSGGYSAFPTETSRSLSLPSSFRSPGFSWSQPWVTPSPSRSSSRTSTASSWRVSSSWSASSFLVQVLAVAARCLCLRPLGSCGLPYPAHRGEAVLGKGGNLTAR